MSETAYRIQPTSLETTPITITNLTAEVIGAAKTLEAKLPAHTANSLADLVRIMNCYYSNLIEGHDTRPIEIQRALEDDIDETDPRRHLQIEALAHIRLQTEIDKSYAKGQLGEPWDRDFITWLHREFYRDALPEMLQIKKKDGTALTLRPGEIRSGPDENVEVGRHIPPSTKVLPQFLDNFEEHFRVEGLRPASAIIASAIAHHRFMYIHPFLDGNGRVGRLASHAMILKAGVGAHGLWSISRGLARGTAQGPEGPEGQAEYKSMLDHADSPRQGDRDGRGNLSEAATIDFVEWWLKICLDQIIFMTKQFDLDRIEERISNWLTKEGLSKSMGIIKECLSRGEMKRGDAGRVTGMPERTARDQMRLLEKTGIIASYTPKGSVRLVFTPSTASKLFPNLFDIT